MSRANDLTSRADPDADPSETAMTMRDRAVLRPDTFWRRWLNKIAAFEAAMEMTCDDVQDRRLERIEAELARLRSELAAVSAPDRR